MARAKAKCKESMALNRTAQRHAAALRNYRARQEARLREGLERGRLLKWLYGVKGGE